MTRKIFFLTLILTVIMIPSCSGQTNETENSFPKQNAASSNKVAIPEKAADIDSSYFGEEPPGLIPKVFAPGIVSSKENYEFKIAFTPDGKEIYFIGGLEQGVKNGRFYLPG